MRTLLIVLVLVVLAAGGGGLWYWNVAGAQTTTFRTAAVERGDLLATIAATGTVEPEEVVDVGAQVAGQIKTLGRDPHDAARTIDYCSEVDEGTVLAQLDDSVFKARVDQAQAAVDEAESQVAQAEADLKRAEADLLQMQAKHRQADRAWERAQRLGPSRAVSPEDYDTARAAYEVAQANIGVAEAAIAQAKAAVRRGKDAKERAVATLREAQINLGYTTIKSPVKGVIIDRRVNVGQTVVASLNAPSLFLIAKDLRRLQVWASVNEADIGSIHAGQAVRFTVDAHPGESFAGEVAQIRLNASMTQNVVTYTVVVNTDNGSGRLLPYLTANLQFEVSRHENALLVPNAALRWRPQLEQVAADARDAYAQSLRRKSTPGGDRPAGADKERHDRATVWVEEGGYVRPVRVRIGPSDGAQTEVVDGDLPEGAAVVVGETRGGSNATTTPFVPQLRGGR
jgi:HlyD family secretion protein